jgi:cytochrome c oxidase subunit 2
VATTTTSAVMRPAIKIPVGALTTLRLTATSGVHGIQSKDLGIPFTTIPNGKTVDVKFTPKKTGTFILHCAIFCRPGHADMKLKIQVVSS